MNEDFSDDPCFSSKDDDDVPLWFIPIALVGLIGLLALALLVQVSDTQREMLDEGLYF